MVVKPLALNIHDMLPDEFKPDYQTIFFGQKEDREHWELVKAADKICAYLKCLEELKAGNQEFAKAEKVIKATIAAINLPEVTYFMTSPPRARPSDK